ncbi:MAG: glycosyltransferase [Gammaproteobacteria bacterium]|nr:glycosyltransferase family 4 protein [Gammaproteobacteria bacterium]NIP87980.1 glycosyltransferase family 4 protein [Gammaproteobacteria bacterium]NIR22138.1 glycosyltransferase family 4 protein [Gammaproteobacteria bacterium]NIS03820.1 glycosyltransferase family 4 protein [Gammaproteobacteria bacterium]NIV46229.1 glycosyltransferase [Gammaproteobacteria bacterium]
MRVLFVNRYFHPDHSATSQMLTDLTLDLARDGMDVVVITSRQLIDDPRARLASREQLDGIDVRRVWSTRFGRGSLVGRGLDYLSFYLGAGWRLARLCRRDDVVVAKTDPPLISVMAALVARARGARLVNWLHDLFPEIAERVGVPLVKGALANALRGMRNRSLQRARCNVVIGARMAAQVKALGIPPERVAIVHNWCDGDLVRPLPLEGHGVRRALHLEGRTVVMYSGNMGYAHEFATVLDAAERLRDRDDIVFLLVGDGVQRSFIEQEIARRRLGNVRMQPYQPRERLAESLTAANVHLVSLLPRLEGLMVPSKFYAIAAAGRPVLFIGAPEGELADLIEEARCGFQIPVGDGAGLAARIEALASDAETARRQGAAARQLFEQRFDRRLATAAWERTLRAVADARSVQGDA